jgi:hypothetical protein
MITLAAVLVGVLAVEASSWFLGWFVQEFRGIPIPQRRAFFEQQTRQLERLAANESARARIHPVLGWSYGTGRVSENEFLNKDGIRGSVEYSELRRPGVVRLAVFGDSNVYCNEVGDSDTWPAHIEASCRAEVLNFGVGGYGADQAFLRFRDQGARFHPDIVVLGFTTMMAARVVSCYRRFQDPNDGPWFKPRFLIDGDLSLRFVPPPVASREDVLRLISKPSAVTEFGRHDYWYNRAVFEHWIYPLSATYRFLTCTGRALWMSHLRRDRIMKSGTLSRQSEAFRILDLVFREFSTAVRASGARPVGLMLPTRSDVRAGVRRAIPSYQAMRVHLESCGIQVIDPLAALAFAKVSRETLFAPGGHLSSIGNAILAKVIAESLSLPS